nr:hypothetical protein [Tanacetum cinerariifolium]
MVVAVEVVAARGVVEKRRVRESGVEGRIDRVTSNLFGFAGKIPPKKFSGGGRRRRVVADRQEAAAAVEVVSAVKRASEGEWRGGSDRSGDLEYLR